MKDLQQLVSALEQHISSHNKINTAVSATSAGWHIEHSLITINRILFATEHSDSSVYKNKFNFWRTVIFMLGKIPRGKVKAPKVVQPKENITEENLREHVAQTKQNLKKLSSFQKNNFFTHPYFGDLNTKQTETFLRIHTNHHLGIIKDIVR